MLVKRIRRQPTRVWGVTNDIKVELIQNTQGWTVDGWSGQGVMGLNVTPQSFVYVSIEFKEIAKVTDTNKVYLLFKNTSTTTQGLSVFVLYLS